MDNREIPDVSIIRKRVKEINHGNENYDLQTQKEK